MVILPNKEGDRHMPVNAYLKFMTETFVKHFEQPKAERKKLRMERKGAKSPLLYRMFGLLPMSIAMIIRKG